MRFGTVAMRHQLLNSRVYCVSCRAPARSARKAARADVVERAASARCGGGGDHRLQRGQHALAVGLAERDQPHAGRDPVGGDGLQEGGKRRLERNAVAGGGDRHRDRIGDRAVPGGFRRSSAGARPGRARRLDEGVALRGGFQMAFLGRARTRRRVRRPRAALCRPRRRRRDARARTARRRRSRRLRRA